MHSRSDMSSVDARRKDPCILSAADAARRKSLHHSLHANEVHLETTLNNNQILLHRQTHADTIGDHQQLGMSCRLTDTC